MFAHRLLARASVGVAMDPEALSVTSCSILFLRCCASALRPSGLTLHWSFNNCCGTVNICKPLLQLACLCVGLLCVCVCSQPISSLFFFVFQRQSAEYFDADPLWYESLPRRSMSLYLGLFLWTKLTLRVNKLGN